MKSTAKVNNSAVNVDTQGGSELEMVRRKNTAKVPTNIAVPKLSVYTGTVPEWHSMQERNEALR